VHLTIAADGPIVGLDAEIGALAEQFPIRLASLAIERPRVEAAPGPPTLRLSERQPVDLFREAFALAHRSEPTPEHLALFHAAAAEE
jgi:exonuclease SbcD